MGGKGQGERGESVAAARELAEVGRRQVGLAEEQAAITKPLRTGTANILQSFLRTGQTPGFLDLDTTVAPLAGFLAPTVQPLEALGLPNIESEQGQLRQRLLAQGSRGGLLQQQLSQAALQGGVQRASLRQQDLLRQEERDLMRTGALQQDVLRQENRDLARAALRQRLFGGAGDAGTGGLALAFQGLQGGGSQIGGAAQQFGAIGQQEMAKGTGIAGQALGAIGTGLGAYAALKK